MAALLLVSCAKDGSRKEVKTDDLSETAAGRPTVVYNAPEGDAWYEENAVVAHALGAVDGRCESNSLQALQQTYARGQKVFEVDFSLTSDGFLVARHDFDDNSYYTLEQQKPKYPVMDLQTFVSTPIMGIYSPATIDDIAEFMGDNGDVWIITDTKSLDGDIVRTQLTLLCEAFGYDGRLDRVIVQLYNTDMYDVVHDVYPFKNYIFTVYQLAERDYNAIAGFCAQNGIAVVTMPASTATTDVTSLLHSHGLRVYVHTVNRITTMGTMLEYSLCDGFYSDYITQPELSLYLKQSEAG